MENSIFTGLLQNTAILLSFSLIYNNFWVENEEHRKTRYKIVMGCIIGAIGIVLMLSPWSLVPGIVFDTRSVMLSISGLLFGPLPTIIAIVIDAAFRIYLGGDGIYMGIAVILFSGSIGILWRKTRSEKVQQKPLKELLLLGTTVHIAMIACTFLLPQSSIIKTLSVISIPLIFVYIPATMLLGTLMLRQRKNWKNRKAQVLLLEVERRFKSILESTNLLTVILNKRGLISYCNDSLLQLTGYEQDEIIDGNFLELFIPEERRLEIRDLFLNYLFSKEFKDSIETYIKGKNEKVFIISWNVTILHDESGNPESIAAIGVNITEQRTFEQNLIEKNLEIKANNRKYVRVNQALKQAKIKAEESEKLTSAFLANMSHEIRTPMNGILGFAELLKNPELSGEEQQEYISIIKKSGDRMLNIINDLVELSRLESGMVPMNYTITNINDQIRFLYNFFLPQAKAKNLQLKLKEVLPSESNLIYTDQEKIYGILTNLIKNALKFTKKGVIEIGSKISENNLIIYVKDSGIGIPQSKIKAVFERFVQADSSFSSQFEGAGLGLSISNAYAKLLKGELTVESTEGAGSVFQFKMPIQLTKLPKTSITVDFQKEVENPGKLINLNALLVEDDDTSMKLIDMLMRKYTSTIYKATSGQEAIDVFKSTPGINLILCDIKMSGMSGLDVARVVRKSNNQVIIIAQTAYALKGDKEIAISAGCNDYLTKPVSKIELESLLNKYFSV
ncbi:MAG: PAS/PAC sensor hybrid histidine kinase [Bacteroidetes bacterium]|nr:MAG: PAS/PAC sensor hybrid histidine kinase [Bacteroidota bacterium]